ncbi:TonB-dependent receptor [Arcticibacter eurypsychrophilus]|uniref:TonB-dependent receptor n=1 Tax=Arcticibacter eurypsychrophilus TaxID=1434752 RepID=UPI00084D431D|nr:TonB-dependent receptor [Arcticibacter eurypsychrophilus]
MRIYFFIAFFITSLSAIAQDPDSIERLDEVQIKAYFNRQPILRLPSTVGFLGKRMLDEQQPQSLVSAVNSIPGVRMEERSPGSYRLSIRGSLLRSPFGIRNVKMYIDDFILTDAGGNTYLNALDAGGVSQLTILKGPEASVYGANTGGVVLINTTDEDSSSVKGSLVGGAYGLFQQNLSLQKKWDKVNLAIKQAYQKSDGYRNNSALDRKYIQALPQWNYSVNASIKAIFLYSDMSYHTPGGLTELQFLATPRASRPASGNNPGAEEQKAGIYNKTLLVGLQHEIKLSSNFKHVISYTGSFTDFKNPFITNYETRKEQTAGLRTYLQYSGMPVLSIPIDWEIGYEGQRTTSDISNYSNLGGVKGTLRSADQITNNQQFVFSHVSFDINSRLILEAAASINFYNYDYGALGLSKSELSTVKFDTQFMPRLAMSYKLSDMFALRASTSRGYSAPTIAEVRASNTIINTNLQPESGWNYETGLRMSLWNNRLYWDGVLFKFDLTDAIVRRLDETDAEYFINAGGTKQSGIESQLMYWVIPEKKTGLLRSLQFRNSYTFSSFSFSNYQDEKADYSGNRLTGVPRHVLVSSISMGFPKNYSLFVQHNFTSSIPLNDAGTAYAKKYHLLQAKASYQFKASAQTNLSIFIGADNILNQLYSLGNDLNAFGSRYFNAAAKRNFFAGLTMAL